MLAHLTVVDAHGPRLSPPSSFAGSGTRLCDLSPLILGPARTTQRFPRELVRSLTTSDPAAPGPRQLGTAALARQLLDAGWQVQSFCEAFDFVFEDTGAENRLDSIGLYKAADLELYDYPFEYYICADNYFQQYLQSDKTSDEPLKELARYLYLDNEGKQAAHIKCSTYELMGVFLRFMWIKHNFSTKFPHLFKPAAEGGEGENDMEASMNAQIRALTGGDITKEETIRKANVWRALTELDAKAREAEELNKKLNKS